MKSKKIKRLLAATLAATLVMASTLTVAASGGSAGSSGSESPKQETSASSSSESSNSGSSSTSVAPSVKIVSSNASMSVAGTAVKTTVAGVYVAQTVRGAAVTTPAAEVAANLGLTSGQKAYMMVFDTDPKKSFRAMECVDAAAAALNGTTVATLNLDLCAKQNGKRITLSQGSVGMVVGLPKNADTSKTYSIVCVQPGGVITILEDQDASPSTVTFEVKAGIGTYGIIAR